MAEGPVRNFFKAKGITKPEDKSEAGLVLGKLSDQDLWELKHILVGPGGL